MKRRFNKVTSFYYYGNRFTCNCCGRTFRKLKDKGKLNRLKAKNIFAARKNAQCPYCESLERTRALLFYLQNETTIFQDKLTVLHFAPELSLASIFKKSKNLTYISADINLNFADYDIDITNIPFADNYFDYIICSCVLGHVLDEKKAIEELYRVLKPSGIALVMTLINWNNSNTYETPLAVTEHERLQHYTEHDLCRLHGTDFDKRLAKPGFKVETIHYISLLGEEVRKRYSLGNGERETIFKCTK